MCIIWWLMVKWAVDIKTNTICTSFNSFRNVECHLICCCVPFMPKMRHKTLKRVHFDRKIMNLSCSYLKTTNWSIIYLFPYYEWNIFANSNMYFDLQRYFDPLSGWIFTVYTNEIIFGDFSGISLTTKSYFFRIIIEHVLILSALIIWEISIAH